MDEVYEIPANEWRYVELGLTQRPALVSATYEVDSGPRELRLALLRSEDLDKLRAGAPHSVMQVTQPAGAGRLLHHVREPGEYFS